MGGDEYTAKMDQQLPEATILLFRRLAHAKVLVGYVLPTIKSPVGHERFMLPRQSKRGVGPSSCQQPMVPCMRC